VTVLSSFLAEILKENTETLLVYAFFISFCLLNTGSIQ